MGLAGSILCPAGQDEDLQTFQDTGGQVRLLIVALGYDYSPGHELTAFADGNTMLRMAQRAGVQDITVVTDKHVGAQNFPTKKYMAQMVAQVASRCEPNDWFVFFYAGHGINVPDTTGDEADGFDQAFVTPDQKGKLSQKAVFIDDDFAKVLDQKTTPGAKILCICDCCHSGTICDIDTYMYKHEIYQISAAQDDQEAEDTGSGGLLTNSLRMTIRDLSMKYRDKEFSIQKVFDGTNRRAEAATQAQNLSLQFSGTDPAVVAWPLCFPWWEYMSMGTKNLEQFEAEDDAMYQG